jgi:hypothetical protein
MIKLAFEEGLKIGYNEPRNLSLAVMSECMRQGEIIGVSISDELREKLETTGQENKLYGYHIMNAKDLSKGLICHYSDGSAIWWDGISDEIEPYWPDHLTPDAFAR